MAVEPVPHRWTVAEYHRMGDAGIFDEDDRVELLDGEIIEMAPIGSPHAAVVARLNRMFSSAVAERAIVWVQNPIVLDAESEPEPDLALLVPRSDYYAGGHPQPADVLLVVEVGDSSIAFDRRRKLRLYAGAGIAETWLVDIPGQVIETHTQPTEAGYASRAVAARSDTVAPAALPDVAVAVAAVLG